MSISIVRMVSLGDRIRVARKAARLTQTQLGDMLGVSAQAVSQWESDLKTPKRDHIVLISDVLGISLSTLLQPPTLHTLKAMSKVGPDVGVVARGREVPLIAYSDVAQCDKFSVRQSTVCTSFPCGRNSFALEIPDSSQSPKYPAGTVVVFDPDRRAEPGEFVCAIKGGATILGILSVTGSGDLPTYVITPLNSHWPARQSAPDCPIVVIGPKTEIHLRD